MRCRRSIGLFSPNVYSSSPQLSCSGPSAVHSLPIFKYSSSYTWPLLLLSIYSRTVTLLYLLLAGYPFLNGREWKLPYFPFPPSCFVRGSPKFTVRRFGWGISTVCTVYLYAACKSMVWTRPITNRPSHEDSDRAGAEDIDIFVTSWLRNATWHKGCHMQFRFPYHSEFYSTTVLSEKLVFSRKIIQFSASLYFWFTCFFAFRSDFYSTTSKS